MKKTLSLIKEQEVLGKEFRMYGTIDSPYFVAADVAEWIGHSDVSMMMKNVDTDEKLIQTILVSGQRRELWFLTEDGLYEVLMQSRKPIAKQFKKQVKEILKTIRKTGKYEAHKDPALKAQQAEIARINAEARLKNADTKQAQELLKIAAATDTNYKQVLHAYAANILTGQPILPLPAVDERTYSAGEIAELLGVSANKIGRLSNENGMKTEYYGKWFYDKSRHSDKQVETFRYYEKAIEVFRKLLEVAA